MSSSNVSSTPWDNGTIIGLVTLVVTVILATVGWLAQYCCADSVR